VTNKFSRRIGLAVTIILSICMYSMFSTAAHVNGSESSVSTAVPYCLSKVRNDTPSLIVDDSGIPIVDYGYRNGSYIGPQRNPVTISDRALQYYGYYQIDKDYNSLRIFLNNVNWLVDNAETHGNYSIFTYKFPWSPYSPKLPWRSDMANGKALEALAKAFNLTGDRKYQDSAKKLLNAFFIDVKDGGLTYKSAKDGWWYEEYASGSGNEPRILNGFMFALLNIYQYYTLTHDAAAKFLFDQGILALKKNLPNYDYNGKYSYYDAHPKSLSPLSYHKLVVQQLEDLYNITKDAVFKRYHDKWQNFELPDGMFISLICHRTAAKPSLVFKQLTNNTGFQTIGGYNSDTGLKPLLFSKKTKSDENFTSQNVNYRVKSITLNVTNLSLIAGGSIIFTFDFDGIHKNHYFLNAVYGLEPVVNKGWRNGDQYFVKAEPKSSVVLNPEKIIGSDYLRLQYIRVNILNQTLVHTVDFTIGLD
jgi:heparosan-N-sulfate-glucuronate 5-epimerase